MAELGLVEVDWTPLLSRYQRFWWSATPRFLCVQSASRDGDGDVRPEGSQPSESGAEKEREKEEDPQRDDTEDGVEHCTDQSPRSRTLSKAQRIAMFVAVTLNAGLVWASVTLMMPFFALETLHKFPHAGIESKISVGLIFSVATYAEFVASPIFALLLRKTGSKLVLVLSSFQISGAIFLFSFVNRIDGWTEFLVLCLLIRVVQGVGMAGDFIASVSLTIGIFPNSTGLASGIYRSSVFTGYALGPVLGGYLYDHGGFALPFYVGSGLLLANTVALALFIPSSFEDKQSEVPAESDIPFQKLFAVPWVWIVFAMMFLGNFKMSFIEPTLPVYFKESFNVPTVYSGSALFAVGIMYCTEAPIIGYLIDRGIVRARLLEIVGLLLTALGCELVGPAPFLPIPRSLWGSYAAMVVIGIAEPFWAISSLPDILQTYAENGFDNPVAIRGAISGIYQAFLALGYGTGPVAGSTLVGLVGFPWATSALGGVHLLLFVVALCGALCLHYRASECTVAPVHNCKYRKLFPIKEDQSSAEPTPLEG